MRATDSTAASAFTSAPPVDRTPTPQPTKTASSPFSDGYDGPKAPPPSPEPPSKTSALIGQLFGSKAIAGIYHWLTDHSLWADQNLGLLDHLGDNALKDPKILDLGAGTGIGTRALARAFEGRGEVIGLDFAAPMVDLANQASKAEALPNLRFMQGDATNLTGFKDNSLDYVVANSFLYLVPNAPAALKEARRVLKPGGRLVFMEPREEGSVRKAAQVAARNASTSIERPYSSLRLLAAMAAWRVMSGLEGRRTEPQLRTLFAEAGFDSVRFEPTLGGLGHHVIAD